MYKLVQSTFKMKKINKSKLKKKEDGKTRTNNSFNAVSRNRLSSDKQT